MKGANGNRRYITLTVREALLGDELTKREGSGGEEGAVLPGIKKEREGRLRQENVTRFRELDRRRANLWKLDVKKRQKGRKARSLAQMGGKGGDKKKHLRWG